MDILTIGAIAIPTVVIGLHYKYTRDLEMIREFLRRTHEETESVEERLLADSQMERAKVEDLLHEIDELRKKVEELQIQKAKFEQKAKLSKSHDEIKDVIFNVIERLYERLGGPAGGLELEDLKASYSNSIEDDSTTDKDSKNQSAEVPNEDKESAQEEVLVEDTTNNELSTEDTIEPEAAAEEEVSSEEKVEVAKEAEEPTTPQEENKPKVSEEESDPSDVAPPESEADLSRRSEAEAEEEIQDLDEDDEDEVLPAKEEKEYEPLEEEAKLSDVVSPEVKANDISDLDEDDEEEQEVVEEPKASKEDDDISDLEDDDDDEVLLVKEEKEPELPEEEEEQSEVDSSEDKEETEGNKSGFVEPSSDSSGEEMITKFVSEFKELIELDGGKENEGYFTAASLGKGEDELKCEMVFIKDEKLFALDLKAHVFIEQLGWSGDDGDNSQLIEEVNNYLKYLSDPNYLESILGLLPEGLEYSGSSVIIALKNNIQVDILNKVAQGFDFANSKIEVKNFNEINDLFL